MAQSNKFLEQIPDVLKHFPALRMSEIDDKSILAGTIELHDERGEVLDSYEIEIHPSDAYPERFPFLYEVGGRIPRNIDWHVYPDTGICCVAVPAEETIACWQGITLTEFVKKYVCGFLFSQTFRRKNGYFYRERSHGLLGSLEYYREILHLPTIQSACTALRVATAKIKLKSNARCFCGSKKKFRKCHRRRVRLLVKMVGTQLKIDSIRLEKANEFQK